MCDVILIYRKWQWKKYLKYLHKNKIIKYNEIHFYLKYIIFIANLYKSMPCHAFIIFPLYIRIWSMRFNFNNWNTRRSENRENIKQEKVGIKEIEHFLCHTDEYSWSITPVHSRKFLWHIRGVRIRLGIGLNGFYMV